MAKRIVIVGGGIIGSSTAYFLTRHPQFKAGGLEIVLIEAVEPAAAASGNAGGLLSSRAFPSSIAKLSFSLHSQLAEEHNGTESWGYRPVTTLSVEGSNGGRHSKPHLPKGLDWVDPKVVTSADVLGGPGSWAQVHPRLFTKFLCKAAVDAGVTHVHGKVTSLHGSKEKITGVTYEASGGSKNLDADVVVVTAGPWTSTLVPAAPIVGLKANSITVDPTRSISAFAMFTELQIDGSYVSPEIYARPNEVYVCGATSDDPLPATAAEVKPNIPECERLFSYAGAISPEIRGGKVTCQQACFLPVAEAGNGPFIGATNVPNLYLSAGHTVWGINNGPATGLLLSEIILDGAAKSANISSLSPVRQFDASKELVH